MFYLSQLTIPSHQVNDIRLLGLFTVFGIIIGLASTVFVRGLYLFEDLFDYVFKNDYVRHMFGMLLVGILMYSFLRLKKFW